VVTNESSIGQKSPSLRQLRKRADAHINGECHATSSHSAVMFIDVSRRFCPADTHQPGYRLLMSKEPEAIQLLQPGESFCGHLPPTHSLLKFAASSGLSIAIVDLLLVCVKHGRVGSRACGCPKKVCVAATRFELLISVVVTVRMRDSTLHNPKAKRMWSLPATSVASKRCHAYARTQCSPWPARRRTPNSTRTIVRSHTTNATLNANVDS